MSKQASPAFIHDTVRLANGSTVERKNSWHGSLGRPGKATLAAAVRKYEASHAGERVLSAKVLAPNGDTVATYEAA